MLGPVLYLEILLGGRRGRQYVFRWLYAGLLLLQLLYFYSAYRIEARTHLMLYQRPDPGVTGRFAADFVELFVVQQFILVLLITPAFTAGAVADEKTRGTLQHLLTAHVTPGEIVVGKLLGRLCQVGVLVLAGLPVLCFIGVFGGLHPMLLATVLAATAIPLFALGAASVLASVWSRQTRDAVVALYAIGAAGCLFYWGTQRLAQFMTSRVPAGAPLDGTTSFFVSLAFRLRLFNPLAVVEPAWNGGSASDIGSRLFGSLLVWGGVGVVCVCLATWRLRAAYIRQLEGSGRKAQGTLHGARPALADGDDPVRWREQHVAGAAPVPWLRDVSATAGIVAVALFTVVSSSTLLFWSVSPGTPLPWHDVAAFVRAIDPRVAGSLFLVQSIGVMLLASLVVAIRCSGAISGEREQQTWEALLLTPLHTRDLIRGKLAGVWAAVLPYVAAYGIPALGLSFLGGFIAFLWTGLWLAVTLLAMYYVGAAGLWCSTVARGSWRSLLGTMGLGYVGGFLIFMVGSPFSLIIGGVLFLFLQAGEGFYGTSYLRNNVGMDEFVFIFLIGSCLMLALLFYVAAGIFLTKAENWVAQKERIRHWRNEPRYRDNAYQQPYRPGAVRY